MSGLVKMTFASSATSPRCVREQVTVESDLVHAGACGPTRRLRGTMAADQDDETRCNPYSSTMTTQRLHRVWPRRSSEGRRPGPSFPIVAQRRIATSGSSGLLFPSKQPEVVSDSTRPRLSCPDIGIPRLKRLRGWGRRQDRPSNGGPRIDVAHGKPARSTQASDTACEETRGMASRAMQSRENTSPPLLVI